MKYNIKFFIIISISALVLYSCGQQNDLKKDTSKVQTSYGENKIDTGTTSKITSNDKKQTKDVKPPKETVKTQREKKKKTIESNPYKKKQNYKSYSKTQYRIGAICRDGTRSYATGRGACSHHGGVAYWLYK